MENGQNYHDHIIHLWRSKENKEEDVSPSHLPVSGPHLYMLGVSLSSEIQQAIEEQRQNHLTSTLYINDFWIACQKPVYSITRIEGFDLGIDYTMNFGILKFPPTSQLLQQKALLARSNHALQPSSMVMCSKSPGQAASCTRNRADNSRWRGKSFSPFDTSTKKYLKNETWSHVPIPGRGDSFFCNLHFETGCMLNFGCWCQLDWFGTAISGSCPPRYLVKLLPTLGNMDPWNLEMESLEKMNRTWNSSWKQLRFVSFDPVPFSQTTCDTCHQFMGRNYSAKSKMV